MLIALAAASLAFAPTPSEPVFTPAALAELTACADGDGTAVCSGVEAEVAVATACVDKAPEADRNEAKLCVMQAVNDCYAKASPTTDAENELAVLVCGARARAGLQVAINNWLTAKAAALPAATVTRMRGMLPEARRQADAQASAMADQGQNAMIQSGVRLGVWAGFGHLLRTQAQAAG